MLENTARYEPDHLAVIFDGNQLTYKQLNDQINRLAHGLMDLGIKRGEFVLTLIPNSLNLLIAYHAVLRTGATIVPLNVMYTTHEIGYIGQDTGACAMIADRNLWKACAIERSELPNLKHVIITNGTPVKEEVFLDNLYSEKDTSPDVVSHLDDIVSIIYTSGTTGQPKGATQTHRSILSNVIGCSTRNKFCRNDRFICALPLYNNFAINVVMMSAFFCGATLIGIDRFDARKVLDVIRIHRGTYFAGTSTMFSYLLMQYKEGMDDVSSLQLTNSGGANCPAEVIRQVEKTFDVIHLDGYGQTEGCGFTTLNPRVGVRKENSVGTPLSNIFIKIFDENGNEMPNGTVGEIVLKGDAFSIHGYHNRPEVNKEVNCNGWFHSGDLGYLDEDGYLFVVDRKNDLIITGGQNIYPAEVEKELYTHPKVALAAIVGVPDPLKGEIAKAYVVLKQGATATEKEMIDYVRGRIAKYKAPRQVEFVESLPQGPTGKILKRVLRQFHNK